MAPSQAAAFKHSTAISRRHSFAEPMHAHTAADFWLVRSFWHSSFLTLNTLLLINIQNLDIYAMLFYDFFLPGLDTGTTLYRKGFDSVNLDSR